MEIGLSAMTALSMLTIFQTGPGESEVTVPEADVAGVVHALGKEAVELCRPMTFDSRVVMRRFEQTHHWPRFINPRASEDYAPDVVSAEGFSAIKVLSKGGKGWGRVDVQISDGVRKTPDAPRQRASCAVTIVPLDTVDAMEILWGVYPGQLNRIKVDRDEGHDQRTTVWTISAEDADTTEIVEARKPVASSYVLSHSLTRTEAR